MVILITTTQMGKSTAETLNLKDNVPSLIQSFCNQFESEKHAFKFISNGLFGYLS